MEPGDKVRVTDMKQFYNLEGTVRTVWMNGDIVVYLDSLAREESFRPSQLAHA